MTTDITRAEFEKWFSTAILPVNKKTKNASYTKQAIEWTYLGATAVAEAKYKLVIDKATALCDQMARNGYQNAKLEAARELREALAFLCEGGKEIRVKE